MVSYFAALALSFFYYLPPVIHLLLKELLLNHQMNTYIKKILNLFSLNNCCEHPLQSISIREGCGLLICDFLLEYQKLGLKTIWLQCSIVLSTQ